MTSLEIIIPAIVVVVSNIVVTTYSYFLKIADKKKLKQIMDNYTEILTQNNKILDVVSNKGDSHRSDLEIEMNEPFIDSPEITHRSIDLNENYKIQVRAKK